MRNSSFRNGQENVSLENDYDIWSPSKYFKIYMSFRTHTGGSKNSAKICPKMFAFKTALLAPQDI